MTTQLIVKVGYVLGFGGVAETHPLLTFIADKEDGAQLSDPVNHRDMRQVRAYYNGWLSSARQLKAGGVHNIVELDVRGRWPFSKRECHLPVNFEYDIAERVPEELRYSNDY
jgi:hypothetical protein